MWFVRTLGKCGSPVFLSVSLLCDKARVRFLLAGKPSIYWRNPQTCASRPPPSHASRRGRSFGVITFDVAAGVGRVIIAARYASVCPPNDNSWCGGQGGINRLAQSYLWCSLSFDYSTVYYYHYYYLLHFHYRKQLNYFCCVECLYFSLLGAHSLCDLLYDIFYFGYHNCFLFVIRVRSLYLLTG